MPTIEEMIKVLKANGYYESGLYNPIGKSWLFWCIGDICFIADGVAIEDSIKIAYEHYLQQQRSAKMEALLEDILKIWDNYAMPSNGDIDLHNAALATQFARTAMQAKAILAEKETS